MSKRNCKRCKIIDILRTERLHIAENQNKSINFVYGDSRTYS